MRYYFSIFKAIDEYIKNNQIEILNDKKVIVFNHKLIDPYFDLAITNKIREIFRINFNGCIEYSLEYDDNDNLCLLASTDDDMCTLVIYNGLTSMKPCFSKKLYVSCPEKKMIENAAMLKYLETDRLRKRKNLLNTAHCDDRLEIERKYIANFASYVFKMYKMQKDALVDFTGYINNYKQNALNIIRSLTYIYRKDNNSNKIVTSCYDVCNRGKKLIKIPNGTTRRIMEIVD